jgi:hypothetical protein
MFGAEDTAELRKGCFDCSKPDGVKPFTGARLRLIATPYSYKI